MALVPSSSPDRRILIDLSHNERILRTPSKYNVPCFDIFKDTYEIVESYEEITYKNIQDYDVLLIGMPQEIFNPSEIEDISRFITNGGGLLLLGEPKPDYRFSESQFINSLSRVFGVEFDDNTSIRHTLAIEIQGQVHPVFQKVEEILWATSGGLTVKEPSKLLLSHENQCILAYCEYGNGRVIFLPDSDFFLFPYVDRNDNRQFTTNILDWLSEEGGPYVHHKEMLDKGLPLIEEGRKQVDSGEYDRAKFTLTRSRGYFENASTIYDSDATTSFLRTIDSLIVDAETGIKADSLFQEGKSLYESGEYALAVLKLEEAKSLYLSLNTEKSEECDIILKECRQSEAEALLNEGISYCHQQQYDLANATLEKALALFTELQDTEKAEECQEWIASCRQNSNILPTSDYLSSVFYVIPVLAVIAIVGAVIWRRNQRKSPDGDAQSYDDKTQIY